MTVRHASTYEGIRSLVLSARQTVARGVDLLQVYTNYEIGRRIVEQEQQGKDRAKYGMELIKELAARLTREFGNGFSTSNLKYMRQLNPPDTIWAIFQFFNQPDTVWPICRDGHPPQPHFALSWSHYVFLIGLNPSKEQLQRKLLEWMGDQDD